MKKEIRNIVITSAILVCFALVVFFLIKFVFLKRDQPLMIDKTANVVTQIKKINELSSATFYEEFILKDTKANKLVDNQIGKAVSHNGKPLIEDNIVIVAKGKVRAGFDLSTMTKKNVMISNDTLYVQLPKVKILDVITNPSDFEIYMEDGKWSQDQVAVVENKAQTQLRTDAIQNGILQKAQKSGVEKLTQILQGFDYEAVVVTVAK